MLVNEVATKVSAEQLRRPLLLAALLSQAALGALEPPASGASGVHLHRLRGQAMLSRGVGVHALERRTSDATRPAPAHRIEDFVDGVDLNTIHGNDEALAVLDSLEHLNFFSKPPGLMDAINSLRCNVCWKRPDVLSHKKCMTFLRDVCKKGEICQEVCTGFKKLLIEECYGDHPDAQYACDSYEYITGEKPPKPEGEDVDTDGDGVPDAEDAFPEDPDEWKDTDGDGIGDNADKDKDGDGKDNDVDAFPEDPKEWADTDGDGTGDNADDDIDGDGYLNEDDACPEDKDTHKDSDGDGLCDEKDDDRDGDGHKNDEDKYPDDPTKWADSDGDGIADSEDKDKDGDGVPNGEDAFPLDPKETKDSDGDGIGDNADDDKDGDGHANDKDVFPLDPKEWADVDADGIGDNADDDRDNDGYADEVDKFPDDKSEWVDSDGDGIGDNSDPDRDGDGVNNDEDAYPDDPTRSKGGVVGVVDPATLNKVEKGLPSQGYTEHSKATVEHDDGKTFTGDWGGEWPQAKDETEHKQISRYCQDNPKNTWCDRYQVHGQFAR